MTVTTQDPMQRFNDEVTGLWRQVGELVGWQSRFSTRFDHLDGEVAVLKADVSVLKTDVSVLKTDVSVLKTDVSVLKTDVAEIKGQLGRLERATARRDNRVDAQLERLIALAQRAERKRS